MPSDDTVGQGADCPAVVIIGAPGTGKSAVGRTLAQALGVGFVESETLAEEAIGAPIAEGMIYDPENTLEALNVAARNALACGGGASGSVLTLSASAPLEPGVMERVVDLKDRGVPVVALTASLTTLVRRNGLNAPQPPGLGTPRAWFRSHLATLNDAYLLIGDYWCDTDRCDLQGCAQEIAQNLGLPFAGVREDQ